MKYVPVLIVGSGIAGLSTAYYLKRKNIEFEVITKSKNIYENNTSIAPANIRLNNILDTVRKCGANEEIAKRIDDAIYEIPRMLEDLGIEFEKSKFGIIPARKTNIAGGMQLTRALCNHVGTIATDQQLIDINIYDESICCLLYSKTKDEFTNLVCNYLVLSTGGFVGIFSKNDNVKSSIGEGIVLAKENGANLKGMSTIMFHPFATNHGNRILTGDEVLFSKGKILNKYEEELLIEPKLEAAIRENNYHDSDIFVELVKTFHQLIKEHGEIYIKIQDQMVRIEPTAHYTSGGIEVDADYRVFGNVFANGENTFDGDKGIGRLPGQAFAFSIVSGKVIADKISSMRFMRPNGPEYIPKQKVKILSEENTNFDLISKNKILSNIIQEIYHYDDRNDRQKLIEYQMNCQNIIDDVLINGRGVKEQGQKLLDFYYKTYIANEILKDKLRRNASCRLVK